MFAANVSRAWVLTTVWPLPPLPYFGTDGGAAGFAGAGPFTWLAGVASFWFHCTTAGGGGGGGGGGEPYM
jgi:hypothetical protein